MGFFGAASEVNIPSEYAPTFRHFVATEGSITLQKQSSVQGELHSFCKEALFSV